MKSLSYLGGGDGGLGLFATGLRLSGEATTYSGLLPPSRRFPVRLAAGGALVFLSGTPGAVPDDFLVLVGGEQKAVVFSSREERLGVSTPPVVRPFQPELSPEFSAKTPNAVL